MIILVTPAGAATSSRLVPAYPPARKAVAAACSSWARRSSRRSSRRPAGRPGELPPAGPLSSMAVPVTAVVTIMYILISIHFWNKKRSPTAGPVTDRPGITTTPSAAITRGTWPACAGAGATTWGPPVTGGPHDLRRGGSELARGHVGQRDPGGVTGPHGCLVPPDHLDERVQVAADGPRDQFPVIQITWIRCHGSPRIWIASPLGIA